MADILPHQVVTLGQWVKCHFLSSNNHLHARSVKKYFLRTSDPNAAKYVPTP